MIESRNGSIYQFLLRTPRSLIRLMVECVVPQTVDQSCHLLGPVINERQSKHNESLSLVKPHFRARIPNAFTCRTRRSSPRKPQHLPATPLQVDLPRVCSSSNWRINIPCGILYDVGAQTRHLNRHLEHGYRLSKPHCQQYDLLPSRALQPGEGN